LWGKKVKIAPCNIHLKYESENVGCMSVENFGLRGICPNRSSELILKRSPQITLLCLSQTTKARSERRQITCFL